MFKLDSIRIKGKLANTALDHPSFIKSDFEMSFLPTVLIVLMLRLKMGSESIWLSIVLTR